MGRRAPDTGSVNAPDGRRARGGTGRGGRSGPARTRGGAAATSKGDGRRRVDRAGADQAGQALPAPRRRPRGHARRERPAGVGVDLRAPAPAADQQPGVQGAVRQVGRRRPPATTRRSTRSTPPCSRPGASSSSPVPATRRTCSTRGPSRASSTTRRRAVAASSPRPTTCSAPGHTFLASGNLLIAGGTQRYERLDGAVTNAAGGADGQERGPGRGAADVPRRHGVPVARGAASTAPTHEFTVQPATKVATRRGATVTASETIVFAEAVDARPAVRGRRARSSTRCVGSPPPRRRTSTPSARR